MFPSTEIFLMRAPSELVAGEGQLRLGGVAIPRPVAGRACREGWEVDTGASAAADLQAGLRPPEAVRSEALPPAGLRI